MIDASRDPVVVRASFAEVGLHELQRLIAYVEAGVQAKGVHLRTRRRSDVVELSDGQRLDKRRSHFRRDDVLAVWFAMVGGELRQKFVVGDAGGRV
jgi:hypothetical protein